MNYPDSDTVTTPGKKTRFSSAALALIVGLALAFSGSAALAIGEPIPGIDIVVKKNPGGIPVTAPTETDGAYQFKGLAPGKYDLSVGGKRVQTLSVGSDGVIKGELNKQSDGTASITFNGQVGVVPDLPGAPVNVIRSNKRAAIAKGEGGDVKPGLAIQGEPIIKIPIGLEGVPGTAPSPDGVKPGISDQAAAGGLISYATAPPPKGGGDKLPGLTGDPIPGVDVKLGKIPGGIVASSKTDSQGNFHFDQLPAGNYELTLPGLSPQSVTVGANRSISGVLSSDGGKASITFNGQAGVVLDMPGRDRAPDQPGMGFQDLRVAPINTTRPGGGEVKPGISDQGAAGGLISYATAPPPKSEEGQLPGLAGEPIPGVDVNLSKEVGGGIMTSSRTDNQGNFHFDKLPAGNYTLKLSGRPAQSLTVGPDGIAGGKVTRSPDGGMSIFDRWGKSVSNTDNNSTRGMATEKPVGFGSGNTMGAGFGAGLGTGMSPPGAAMGGAGGPGAGMNPMSPGAGGPMGGGSGGAMRP
jgi:hypothetical protein